MSQRDDFNLRVKELLAKRVSYRCSNPVCRRITIGANSNPIKTTNIGVAAHICAAASGGPRYDENMSSEQRKAINNGIWLCQECSVLIDKDPELYPIETLLEWKNGAEEKSKNSINNRKYTMEEGFFLDFEEESFVEFENDDIELRSPILCDITSLLAACRGTDSWDNRSELKLYSWLENHSEDQINEIEDITLLENIRKSLLEYFIVHLEMNEEQMNIVEDDHANRDIIMEWVELHPGATAQKIASANKVSISATEEAIFYLEAQDKIEKMKTIEKYSQPRWIKKY